MRGRCERDVVADRAVPGQRQQHGWESVRGERRLLGDRKRERQPRDLPASPLPWLAMPVCDFTNVASVLLNSGGDSL